MAFSALLARRAQFTAQLRGTRRHVARDANRNGCLFRQRSGTLSYLVWPGVNFLDLDLEIRMMRGEDSTLVFREVECSCPYLGVTRDSIVRDLLGGWPVPKNLSAAQKRAWRFHPRRGSGASRASALAWIA